MDIQKISECFEHCLYFSMSKMQRQISSMAELSFKELDIAPSYAFLLMSLNENDKLSSGQVGEIIGVCPSTTTRFVDKLIQKDLCKRTIIARNSYVSIKKKGKEMMPEINKCWKILCKMMNDTYGKADVDNLNDAIVELNNKNCNTKCYCDK